MGLPITYIQTAVVTGNEPLLEEYFGGVIVGGIIVRGG